MKDLHAAIKLCEPALVAVDDAPRYIRLGPMQEVCNELQNFFYGSGDVDLILCVVCSWCCGFFWEVSVFRLSSKTNYQHWIYFMLWWVFEFIVFSGRISSSNMTHWIKINLEITEVIIFWKRYGKKVVLLYLPTSTYCGCCLFSPQIFYMLLKNDVNLSVVSSIASATFNL